MDSSIGKEQVETKCCYDSKPCNEKGDNGLELKNYIDHNPSNCFIYAEKGLIDKCVQIYKLLGPCALDQFDKNGNHVLHAACKSDSIQTVIFVLTNGSTHNPDDILNSEKNSFKIDPNICTKNDDKFMPIHIACINNNVNVAEFLLNIGVSIESKDARDRTPLLAAVIHKNMEVAMLLIARGANIRAEDVERDTCLHWSSYNGYVDFIYLFINLGLDVNQPDNHNQTSLHLAGLKNKVPTIKALLSQSPNLSLLDNDNNTPLDVARNKKNEKVAYLITSHMHKKNAWNIIEKIRNDFLILRLYILFSAIYFLFLLTSSIIQSTLEMIIFVIYFPLLIALVYTSYDVYKHKPSNLNYNVTEYLATINKCTTYSYLNEIMMHSTICHKCCNVSDGKTIHCPKMDRCILEYEDYDFLTNSAITKKSKAIYVKFYVVLFIYFLLASIICILRGLIFKLVILYAWPLCSIIVRLFFAYHSYKNNIPIYTSQQNIVRRFIDI